MKKSLISLALIPFTVLAFDKEYMVVDLSGGLDAKTHSITYLNAIPDGGWSDEYKTDKLVLRYIRPGEFTMGSPLNELGREDREDLHKVTLTKPYYIGVFEVTQKQYFLVMGTNPSTYGKGDTNPVELVKYDDIRGTEKGAQWPAKDTVDDTSFMGKLRAKSGQAFDLPTEAQWEFACRAGTTTSLNSKKNITTDKDACPNLDEVAWYEKNSGNQPHPVGTKLPNAWGLYDMHGNVWEWCLDCWTPKLQTASARDPKGAPTSHLRLLRGGGWFNKPWECRSAERGHARPHIDKQGPGFRIASP